MTTFEPLTRSLQEDVLTLLCMSDSGGEQIADLIDTSLFEGEYRLIAEAVIRYRRKYKKAPGANLATLFADIIDDRHSRRAEAYKRIVGNIIVMSEEGLNEKFILDKIRNFTRLQHLKSNVLRAAEILNQPGETSIEQVEDIFATFLRTSDKTFDAGLDASNIEHLFEYLDAREHSEFTLGIPVFDRLQIAPSRGELLILLGAVASGKSWFLQHVGRQALVSGKRVLHVTLEMSEEEVQKRYFQSFMALALNEKMKTVKRAYFEKDDSERLGSISFNDVTAKFSLQRPNRKQIRALSERSRGAFERLRIKAFPTRSLTVSALRAYLITLEAQRFVPDLIVLDYAGIMKTDSENHRISLGNIVEELRGLATERNIALVTAQQVNRLGAAADNISMSHVSEDFSLVHTADVVMTLTSTQRERERKLARLVAVKNRSGKQEIGVAIAQNYDHGQFLLDSVFLDENYSKRVGTL
jgi:replicative DNA helicase